MKALRDMRYSHMTSNISEDMSYWEYSRTLIFGFHFPRDATGSASFSVEHPRIMLSWNPQGTFSVIPNISGAWWRRRYYSPIRHWTDDDTYLFSAVLWLPAERQLHSCMCVWSLHVEMGNWVEPPEPYDSSPRSKDANEGLRSGGLIGTVVRPRKVNLGASATLLSSSAKSDIISIFVTYA